MSSAELQEIMARVNQLSPEDRQELRRTLEGGHVETPEQALGRKMRESGMVTHPPRTGPRRPPSEPVQVEGKPLSESVVEERR